MPLFDHTGRLAYDGCSVEQRDEANRDLVDYVFSVLRPPAAGDAADAGPCGSSSGSGVLAAALANRKMMTWDGYGMGPGAVECDGRMRGAARTTRQRAKTQLPKRVFFAAPDLAHGGATTEAAVEVESRFLSGGVDTSAVRRCHRLGETQIDRFFPGVCQVDVRHIVPEWTAGGASSRDISRSAAFRTLVASGAVGAGPATARRPPGAEAGLLLGGPGAFLGDPEGTLKGGPEGCKAARRSARAARRWEKNVAIASGLPITL
jgi:hypothetical protein